MTLKEIRKQKGLTQEQAAKVLNVPLRTYKRYDVAPIEKSNYKLSSLADELKSFKKNVAKKQRVKKQNLTIIGAGFVGLNTGLVYSKAFDITFVDKSYKKRASLQNKFKVAKSVTELENVNIALICLPTDYNEKTHSFETKDIETTIEEIFKINRNALVIIRSTVGIGYTDFLCKKFNKNIVYMPEFLKEKTALEDVKNPIRVIVGTHRASAKLMSFIWSIETCTDIPSLANFMKPKEAEMVKLYSNAYLAMRVTFYNQLDEVAYKEKINTKVVIDSLGLDQRIGNEYNNPSFGYSGYCLPKDLKVLANYTKSDLLKAVDLTNNNRKAALAKEIVKLARKIDKKPLIGIYKLESKREGNKLRSSSSIDLLNELKKLNVEVIVYDDDYVDNAQSLKMFKAVSTLIVTNAIHHELDDVKDIVFCRAIK